VIKTTPATHSTTETTMPLYINTNVSSLKSQHHLATAQTQVKKSFERLSSGLRINSAADDAAGLAISESLKAQTRSYAVAERNGMNAVSMVETAEGGLGEIAGVLGRMRELATQAANGDLKDTDRDALDAEYQELLGEVDRVVNSTEFNGIELLSGTAGSVDFQIGVGTSTDDVIDVTFGGVSTSSSDLDIAGTDLTGTDATNAKAAMDALDAAIESVSAKRATFGAKINRMHVAVSNAQSMRTNLEAANSRIRDVDVAEETSKMARFQVLQQAGVSILAQANQAPGMALSLMG
jgi:flagellin